MLFFFLTKAANYQLRLQGCFYFLFIFLTIVSDLLSEQIRGGFVVVFSDLFSKINVQGIYYEFYINRISKLNVTLKP